MGDKPTFVDAVAEIKGFGENNPMVQMAPSILYHWFWENQDAITPDVTGVDPPAGI